jgi:pimeloyl-ACP methyl ester carboxylesterase
MAAFRPRDGLRYRSHSSTVSPDWFRAALDHQPERLETTIDGCRIHVRAWGKRTQPPLVLVHGGGAHSGWWDHIAPFFASTHRVIAPDLSGHGDSGSRPTYHLHAWADEVIAAANIAGAQRDSTVVGHGMGGLVAARAAQRHGEHLDGIVIVDSPLGGDAPEQSRLRNRKRPTSAHVAKEDILARFVPVPGRDSVLPYVGHHIANQSVRRTLHGWSWKFDPAVFDAPLIDLGDGDQEIMETALVQMPCRVGYLRCEAGLVSNDMAAKIRSVLQLRGPFVELPLAGHHPMLDQPVGLVAALRTLLEMWSIS